MNRSTANRIKKKKTRKCLNELRKKSLSLELLKNKENESHNERGGKPKAAISKITNNRLTMKLGMFSKGVRSETVTRPALSEDFVARKTENLYKIIDLANGKPSHTITSGAYEKLVASRKLNNAIENVEPVHIAIEGNINIQDNNFIVRSPSIIGSPICTTPPDQIIKMDSWEEERPQSVEEPFVDISSPESASNSVDEELYAYYKDWIDEIPSYLSSKAPKLMEGDIIEKTKQYLQRVYSENCQVDSDSSLLDITKSKSVEAQEPINNNSFKRLEQTMKESILLNPIEYIKSYGQTQAIETSPEVIYNPVKGNGSTYSSSTKYALVDDEIESDQRHSYFFSPEPKFGSMDSGENSDRMSLENDSTGMIDDSPVMIYYPRKLNP